VIVIIIFPNRIDALVHLSWTYYYAYT